jgi:diaminohydroxyphosphoribosylaminopyrimidine deaminase/5-amino-6-(5-phosphoribosylamino)uracil reductase
MSVRGGAERFFITPTSTVADRRYSAGTDGAVRSRDPLPRVSAPSNAAEARPTRYDPSMDDERFMRAALREAAHGVGQTSPNPAVGAVIVHNGRIVARGFHRCAGLPHAEIEALRALPHPDKARGATLYVTLEPCSTHGRTPPCVQTITNAGFSRVVIGTLDPNPAHAGRGPELLRAAGINVRSGVLEAPCRELNRAYNKWIVSQMPFVIAKAGMSLDGRLTRPPGESPWLTNAAARAEVQRLRAGVDAIMIGANTLRIDNPHLTVRDVPGARQPWRVVVSHGGKLPKTAHLFTDRYRERTLVYRGKSLRAVLRDLGQRMVTSVLLEGGMRLFGSAFDDRLVDRVEFYVAPLLCGGPIVVVGGRGARTTSESARIADVAYHRVDGNLHMSGTPVYPEEL